MINFSGSNYSFEKFIYISNKPLVHHINMGRVFFNHSPIGIDYVEGLLYETENEFVENVKGEPLEELIIEMTILNIYKIKFKNGDEIINNDIKNMEISQEINIGSIPHLAMMREDYVF